MTWPHNRRWKAFAPSPTREDKDDELATMDYAPNGDQRHRYNLGWGCRWVSTRGQAGAPYLRDDDSTRTEE